jgi:predicted nucleic acid-binding protein
MSTFVVLDASPLGLATNPQASASADECLRWIESLFAKGITIVVPEIADYEVRRELLRANKQRGVRRLDEFKAVAHYLPITTASMLRAAEFWAESRRRGQPTADARSLDADVILAAQVSLLLDEGKEAVIATTNVGHLSQFVPAKKWSEIS